MVNCASFASTHHRGQWRGAIVARHAHRPLRPHVIPTASSRVTRLSCTSPGAPASTTDLLELNSENYFAYINEEAVENLVVVDFYTDWCGPCKLMYPDLLIMQKRYADKRVRFVKFNCNKANKEIGKVLGVRVAPTFYLYKDKKKVAELRGAKIDELRSLVDEHL